MKNGVEAVKEERERFSSSLEPVLRPDNEAGERGDFSSEKELRWNAWTAAATWILWGLAGVFLICLMAASAWPTRWPKVPASTVEIAASVEPRAEQISAGDFSEYENIFRRRNIFETGSTLSPLTASEDSPTGFDLAGRYRLVGLIVDQNPQIIVEDQTTNETKFLKPGDSLDGAVLDDIQDGRALFLYNGQRMELKP